MEKVMPHCAAQRMPRVLIVEDDLTQRSIWARMIEVIAPSAEIHWADSYEQAEKVFALKNLLSEGFDLLISDVFLKGKATGFDFVKDYFHKFNGQVILVSSFGEVEPPAPVFENLKRSEPIYLKKPLDLRQTVSVLRKLLTPHA